MSQEEVQSFLRKYKDKWFTNKQIAKELDINTSSCSNNLKRLRMRGFTRRRDSTDNSRVIEYSYKEDQENIMNRRI